MAVAPAAKPRQVLVTPFATTNPKGFGLMQRDRQWNLLNGSPLRTPPQRLGAPLHPLLGPRPCGTGSTAHARRTHDKRGAYWVPQQLPAPARRWKSATSWHGRRP